jgi:predicted naringenin-chalcone synthase
MSFQIHGIGTATPAHRIAQADAAELAKRLSTSTADRGRGLETLYRRTGVRTRHSVLLHPAANGTSVTQSFYEPAASPHDYGPTTSARMRRYEAETAPLAFAAAQAALAEADGRVDEITHLITVSCSGFAAPGFDLTLIRELGLPADTQRTHVGFMGCHGALNGLRVAQAFAAAQPNACVLLCAVELCSLHHQYHGPADQLVANALFADGAAAIVGRAATDEQASRLLRGNRTADGGWLLRATGSTVIPNTEDHMTWQIRDHGFEMTLSPRVPDVIEQQLRPWLDGWLARLSVSPRDVGSWAVHPGGPRIVQACGTALGLSAEQLAPSLGVLADYGNMSSPTVLFILDRLRRQNAARPCVTLAFGPGLTVEAALLE